MKWIKKDIDAGEVRSLAARYELDLLTASILVRRGIKDPEELKFFLEKDLRFLHNPFDFAEMEDLVERILMAAEEGEKVKIFGDRDTDGITSTVMMMEVLQDLGVEASWALPRGDEPYGLSIKAVDDFAAEGGTLFITVDCGISNNQEIQYAASLGIDTLVIDHHNPPEELPAAYAIVNPKLEDSGYPFEGLAGCGVTAKVVWALRFSRTDFYNQSVILLNIIPAGNDSFIMEAVKLLNLVETDRLRETLVPGMVDLERTRLRDFLFGQILVYDAERQAGYLKRIFGPQTEVGLLDLMPEINRFFPALKGKSLLMLREKSRIARYRLDEMGELDLLISLFISYIFKREESLSESYKKLLDLVALGTLADLMPLRDENRILIKQGMQVLNKAERPALNELCNRQGLTGKTLSTTDVGWQITPVINATGRMGVPEKAAELLLSQVPEEMRRLADEVVELNRERKKLGEKAWDRILPKARTSFKDLEEKLIMVTDKELQRGITGIISARLVKFFGVPSIALSVLEDKAVGSMRSFKGFNAKDFLGQFSDLFMDYGGHDFAAGFSLELDYLEEFKTRLKAGARALTAQEIPEESVTIDAELKGKHLSPELIDVVEKFEPYGEGHPPLVFLGREMIIGEVQVVGRNEIQHLKLRLDSENNKWPAVFWGAADRLSRDFSLGDRVDVVFRLGRNYFQNRENLQLTVMDLKKCED